MTSTSFKKRRSKAAWLNCVSNPCALSTITVPYLLPLLPSYIAFIRHSRWIAICSFEAKMDLRAFSNTYNTESEIDNSRAQPFHSNDILANRHDPEAQIRIRDSPQRIQNYPYIHDNESKSFMVENILENQSNHPNLPKPPKQSAEPLNVDVKRPQRVRENNEKQSSSNKIGNISKQAGETATLPADAARYTPAWLITQAFINGLPINDIEFYIEDEDASAFANRTILEYACPQLLKRISKANVLIFNAKAEGDFPPLRPQKSNADYNFNFLQEFTPEMYEYDTAKLTQNQKQAARGRGFNLDAQTANQGPFQWLKFNNPGKKAMRRNTYSPSTKMPPLVPPPAPPVQTLQPLVQQPRSDRINVLGCTMQSLRALLFYLITLQFRFYIPPRNIPGAKSSAKNPSWFPKGNDPDAKEMMRAAPLFNVQSAYALATDLGVEHLQSHAQSFLMVNLQADTVLAQYFTPFTQRYPPIRRGILAFIEAHWHEVRQKAESQETLIRLAHGDFPQAHAALFKLLSRLDVSKIPPTPSSLG